MKTAEEAKASVHKVGVSARCSVGHGSHGCLYVYVQNQVAKKVALSTSALQAQVDLLRGAVTIAYPMGLPEHETLPGMIEGKEELEGAAVRVATHPHPPCVVASHPRAGHGVFLHSRWITSTRTQRRSGGRARSSSVTKPLAIAWAATRRRKSWHGCRSVVVVHQRESQPYRRRSARL